MRHLEVEGEYIMYGENLHVMDRLFAVLDTS